MKVYNAMYDPLNVVDAYQVVLPVLMHTLIANLFQTHQILNKVLNENTHKCQLPLRVLRAQRTNEPTNRFQYVAIAYIISISSDTWKCISHFDAKQKKNSVERNVFELAHKALHNSTLVHVLSKIEHEVFFILMLIENVSAHFYRDKHSHTKAK